jgi:hypothetical protein
MGDSDLWRNPLASILPDLVHTVRFGDTSVVVGGTMAVDWIPYLHPDTSSVVLLAQIAEPVTWNEIALDVIEGTLSEEQISDGVHVLIDLASGRPWWMAQRQIKEIYSHWDLIGGTLTLAGVRADTIPLAAWLDAAWQVIRNLYIAGDEDAIDRLHQLETSVRIKPVSTGEDGEPVLDDTAFERALAAM